MNDAFARLPALFAAHVQLSLAALALALAISVPLGVAAHHRPLLARIVLGFASLVQTIPALALLALFYPLLLALSALLGGVVPALGFLPALLALTLYALLPILRNLIAGLRGVDPAVTQAADSVGMTPAQKLWLVEGPLALPVAMAGLRVAAVWTVGAATLATTVGQPCLGDLIFAGLQTQNWPLVLVGCIGAAALALAVDALLGVVEWGVARRRRVIAAVAGAVLAAGALAATLPLLMPAPRHVVTIGAKNFSEQYILSRLIGRRLAKAGYVVRYRDGLGSSLIYRALASGDVDIYVDYAGTLWTNEMKRTDTPPPARMIPAIAAWTKGMKTNGGGVVTVGALGFENAYAFAVRGADARDKGLRTLDDLSHAAPSMRLGSDLEFLDRPEWRAVRAAYGLNFAETRAFSPSFMYRALQSGRVDAISAFSSDGRIAACGFATLGDPRHATPGYDALLLAAPGRAGDARLMTVLRGLVGRIDIQSMRRANYLVDRDADKRTPEQAATWLDARIGG